MPHNQNDKPQDRQAAGEEERVQVHFHLPQDLEYVYRDIFNVYVGTGDVVIELGNLHRSMPGHATISDRIVVSVSNAYVLVQTLQQALQAAQLQLQQQMNQARKDGR
ncbi:hypothetical protein [Desulfobulbus elongatus]|uniref:hypothetical protein n=1 Tax=Desulfobulbus elongatus TaxID=53332 RepID=UPI000484299F|nr:hypothetical protein [Desulfobulbus elongatus]